jgi:hypothetical protein
MNKYILFVSFFEKNSKFYKRKKRELLSARIFVASRFCKVVKCTKINHFEPKKFISQITIYCCFLLTKSQYIVIIDITNQNDN